MALAWVLRYDWSVRTRFLLGPAGSGKTFRCREEIRAALRASPEGPPLVLLAPKQATFQLERQLLSDPALPGYTRLHILSFERLAEFVLAQRQQAAGRMLEEEGRVMVLRALLAQEKDRLQVFHASARLPGLAQAMSLALRECQRYGHRPDYLLNVATQSSLAGALGRKLHDMALIQQRYEDWLKQNRVADGDGLLSRARAELETPFSTANPDVVDPGSGTVTRGDSSRANLGAPLRLGGLWLDGFAELTPQELDLLAGLAPHCDSITLAFCLANEPIVEPSWISTWSAVGQTFRQCHQRMTAVAGNTVQIEVLRRGGPGRRFFGNPVLSHLEQFWDRPEPFGGRDGMRVRDVGVGGGRDGTMVAIHEALRLVYCLDPESEAVEAAREIWGFVRSGGRFRDCAVLVRRFEGYHEPLRRVFGRYEIPYFLDRRESVTHHPLAELTRYALRTVAYGWEPADWFGMLKTGLMPATETEIDRLENEALARGWRGTAWLRPMAPAEDRDHGPGSEALRRRLVDPIRRFTDLLAMNSDLKSGRERPGANQAGTGAMDESGSDVASEATSPTHQPLRVPGASLRPTGAVLVAALRLLWRILDVENILTNWSTSGTFALRFSLSDAIHATVWQEMNRWLENLEAAFPAEAMTLNEWMPVLEAGLTGLTVGLIPPAIDQVLIGAVDRSRNPDLKLVLLLGLNESVFPARPNLSGLLTETDRDQLAAQGMALGPNKRAQLGREEYYGYIGGTRAAQRLVLTWSAHDASNRVLNPSPFVARIQGLFPGAPIESALPGPEHGAMPGISSGFKVQAHDRPAAEATRAHPWWESVHPYELRQPLLDPQKPIPAAVVAELRRLPGCESVLAKQAQLLAAGQVTRLSRGTAVKLYGPELLTSASRLEEFAECPFKFLIQSGWRAKERERFETDPREKGSFQHEILRTFHRELEQENKRWRDLNAAEARDRIGRIGERLLAEYHDGLFAVDEAGQFAGRVLIGDLQKLIGVLIDWMPQYEFDPIAAEVGFGLRAGSLPGWRLDLGDGHALVLRGQIDRIDVSRARRGRGDPALAVVIDYKSRAQKLDPIKLHHGLELQLLVYLGWLRHLTDPPAALGGVRLAPAGVFYLGLKGHFAPGRLRTEVLAETEAARREAYQHSGRFNADFLRQFDNRNAAGGDQFKYMLNQDGSLSKRLQDAMTAVPFERLLDQVEQKLVEIGRRIFAGETTVSPFRKGSETACDSCSFRGICRFDPWTEPYRILRSPRAEESGPPPVEQARSHPLTTAARAQRAKKAKGD